MSVTKRSVEALLPGRAIWDDAVRGFGARRQLRDPFYVVKYRVDGRQRMVTIGRHGSPWTPELARKEALRLLGQVASGNDPASPTSTEDTFGTVVEAYLRAAEKWQRPNTRKFATYYLTKVWKPLHGKPLATIKRRDIAALLGGMSGQSAVNARTTLSAMFNWAIGEGYDLAANPVTGTNRPQGAKGRDRVLTADELRAVYRACGDDDFGRVVRLLILTGQRRKEVGEMTEEEIVGDVWTIPAERAKNHNANDVPLTLLALNVIGKRKPSGRLWRVGSWSRAKAALDAKLTGIAPWTLHDLRRTFATGCADLGVLPHVVEAAINHVSGHKAGVAGIYNRARYAPEVKAALTLWADHVQALVARK